MQASGEGMGDCPAFLWDLAEKLYRRAYFTLLGQRKDQVIATPWLMVYQVYLCYCALCAVFQIYRTVGPSTAPPAFGISYSLLISHKPDYQREGTKENESSITVEGNEGRVILRIVQCKCQDACIHKYSAAAPMPMRSFEKGNSMVSFIQSVKSKLIT